MSAAAANISDALNIPIDDAIEKIKSTDGLTGALQGVSDAEWTLDSLGSSIQEAKALVDGEGVGKC